MRKIVFPIATTIMSAVMLFQLGGIALDRGPISMRVGQAEGLPLSAAHYAKTWFEPSEIYKFSKIKARIKKYQETNQDVKGWLTIPNTNINEPIVHSGIDNDYYGNRAWDGTHYPNNNYANYVTTASYLDCRTRFGETWAKSSRNMVIYGHNWSNLRPPFAIGNVPSHTMFGQLPSYTSIEFARANPYIYYSSGENEGIWKVFAVAYCELSPSFDYNSPNPNKENYQILLDEWNSRTMFRFNVEVETTDRILTLSTCTRQYNMGPQQRFVVVARLLREGESDTDRVKVSVNKDMKMPQF